MSHVGKTPQIGEEWAWFMRSGCHLATAKRQAQPTVESAKSKDRWNVVAVKRWELKLRTTTDYGLNAPTCIMRQISLFISRTARELLKWRLTAKVGEAFASAFSDFSSPEDPSDLVGWRALIGKLAAMGR
ncbi:GD19367 [Drosophila simulans]|uniref:GD19367 n=1 Tax=Drosophila simulans TaxID=7240 RepID=B4R1T5_DROSI|nr:GD19367 [Drosophila simulans]